MFMNLIRQSYLPLVALFTTKHNTVSVCNNFFQRAGVLSSYRNATVIPDLAWYMLIYALCISKPHKQMICTIIRMSPKYKTPSDAAKSSGYL